MGNVTPSPGLRVSMSTPIFESVRACVRAGRVGGVLIRATLSDLLTGVKGPDSCEKFGPPMAPLPRKWIGRIFFPSSRRSGTGPAAHRGAVSRASEAAGGASTSAWSTARASPIARGIERSLRGLPPVVTRARSNRATVDWTDNSVLTFRAVGIARGRGRERTQHSHRNRFPSASP